MTPRRAVVASDLDRTLIWSANAAGDVSDALCVELYEGKPLSYIATGVVEPLGALVAGGLLVPVTTRTEAQYRRVTLPGGTPRFAVCLNGGRVLVDGVEDAAFSEQVAGALRGASGLAVAREALARWLDSVEDSLGAARQRQAEEHFHYAVFDNAVEPGPETAALRDALAALGWTMSVQGRKVYAVPDGLTKQAALGYLERSYGVEIRATAGDSLLDAGMLAAYGRGWIPRDSELHRGGSDLPADVTRATGLAAGAEIVAGFTALV